jgi:hypothetical protein
MRIEELVSSLVESQGATGPADEQAVWAFAEACDRADTDKREEQRIRDIADWIDAEDTSYTQALAALDRGDHAAASPLLRQCARAGIGESAWLLGGVLGEAGNVLEAIAWYGHAAHDGDGRAEAKLTDLLASLSVPDGPGTSGEQDLDALLSGETNGIPDAPGTRAAEAQHGSFTARTLLLSPTGRGKGRPPHHRLWRGAGAIRRPVAVAVVAAVIVIAAVLTGVLSTPTTQLAHFGHRSTASARGTAAPSITQRVDGAGSREPIVRTAPTAPTASGVPLIKQSPGELCREYYSFFEHQEPPSSFAGEITLGVKLNALVGGGPANVFGYCFPYLGNFLGSDPGNMPGS